MTHDLDAQEGSMNDDDELAPQIRHYRTNELVSVPPGEVPEDFDLIAAPEPLYAFPKKDRDEDDIRRWAQERGLDPASIIASLTAEAPSGPGSGAAAAAPMAAIVTATLTLYKVLACSSTDFWQVDPGHLYIPRAWQGVARSARLRGARTAVLYDANGGRIQNIAGDGVCARCLVAPWSVTFV